MAAMTLAEYQRMHRAHYLVRKAVNDRNLRRPNRCSRCKRAASGRSLHGHHADYESPLAVEWLCASCHRKEHGRNGGDVDTAFTRLHFQVPGGLKLRLDAEVARNLRATLRNFCISAIIEKLDRNGPKKGQE